MNHYELSPQERTQIDGRYHNASGPLCGTGDGHREKVAPSEWSGGGVIGRVDCPRCCEHKNKVAPRERNRVLWAA